MTLQTSTFPEQSPLFDISSEPAQSIKQNTNGPIVVTFIAYLLLILLTLFVVRNTVEYLMTKKKR